MSLDNQLYLEFNRLAKQTTWAHSVIIFYAESLCFVALALVVVLAFVRARTGASGMRRRLAAALFAASGGLLATIFAGGASVLIDRGAPSRSLRGAEVLVGRSIAFGMPDVHLALAGAVGFALWIGGDRLLGALAVVLGVLSGLADLYVGAVYPSDALAGLAFGVVMAALAWPLARPLLTELARASGAPIRRAIPTGASAGPPANPGPAARREPLALTGAVRMLSEGALRPVVSPPGGPARYGGTRGAT